MSEKGNGALANVIEDAKQTSRDRDGSIRIMEAQNDGRQGDQLKTTFKLLVEAYRSAKSMMGGNWR